MHKAVSSNPSVTQFAYSEAVLINIDIEIPLKLECGPILLGKKFRGIRA